MNNVVFTCVWKMFTGVLVSGLSFHSSLVFKTVAVIVVFQVYSTAL